MIDTDETNFSHNLLLTDRQVASLCNVFANNSSNNIKLSKTQLSKIIHPVWFFGKCLQPLTKVGLPLMKNVPTFLAKIVLVPLGLTAAAEDTGIPKISWGLEQ